MMEFPAVSFAFILAIGLFMENDAVPLSLVSNEVSNSIGEVLEDAIVIEDDITTHGLERLSSAATCLVAGVEYTHGQQIYRNDPCEFCLCLDGEMFCWWQDCPPAVEGPCKDRGPFSPCINAPGNSQSSFSLSSRAPSSTSTNPTSTSNSPSQRPTTSSTSSSPTAETSTNSSDNSSDSTSFTEEDDFDFSSEVPNTSTMVEVKHCIVMGREYQIGDKLPHDTGNCIECICGQGAKVTCSPHQCAPAGEDINDYRPPGPRQQIPDVF